MGSYLDGAGLTQVWGKLKDKIDAAKEVKSLTKAEYDALEEKEQNVIYSVTDGEGDSATTSIWLNGEQLNEKYKNVKILEYTTYYTKDLVTSNFGSCAVYLNKECTKQFSIKNFDTDTIYVGSCRLNSKNNTTPFKETAIIDYLIYIDSFLGASSDYVFILTSNRGSYLLNYTYAAQYLRVRFSTYNTNVFANFESDARLSTDPENGYAPLIHNGGNICLNGYTFDASNVVYLNNVPKNTIYKLGHFTEHFDINYESKFPVILFIKYSRGDIGLAELILSVSLSYNGEHDKVVITQLSGRISEDCPLGDFIFSNTGLYVKFKTNTPTVSSNSNADNLSVGYIGNTFIKVKPSYNADDISSNPIYFVPINGFKQQIGNNIIFETGKDYADVNNLSLEDYNSLTTKDNKTFYIAESFEATESPTYIVSQGEKTEGENGPEIITNNDDVILGVNGEAYPVTITDKSDNFDTNFEVTIDTPEVTSKGYLDYFSVTIRPKTTLDVSTIAGPITSYCYINNSKGTSDKITIVHPAYPAI